MSGCKYLSSKQTLSERACFFLISFINHFIFKEPDVFGFVKPKLEEGGFYIISRNENGLKMEYEFHPLKSFIRQFYTRQ